MSGRITALTLTWWPQCFGADSLGA
jgi:hypothetical protein